MKFDGHDSDVVVDAEGLYRIEESEPDRVLLIGSYRLSTQRDECEEHLNELALLTETYGAEVVARVGCHMRKVDAGMFLGKGKLQEMVDLAKAKDITLVIFDDEILPSQQRNLEQAFGLTVMDRTELILEVFNQRAQTREARLQIDLARVKYQFPRLKRLWTHLSRQKSGGGAGGAAVKGEGETQMELDKRMLQTRLERIEKDLTEVRQHRETQRAQRIRSDTPVFALIGYTNAGKSTLLNTFTDAGVFAEDKLFATLDTTTRKTTLPNNQEALLIDTVGFIRKLPHLLVAAFKSTLEESVFADILLHVVDASHPNAEEQARATMEVLHELKADGRPIITVLNKVDRDDPVVRRNVTRLRLQYPHTVPVSALTGEGMDALKERMEEELQKQRRTLFLCVPQSDYKIVADIMRQGQVLSQEYIDNDIIMRVEVPVALAGRLETYIQEV